MAPSKIYEFSTSNLMRTKAIVQETNSTKPCYELDLSFALKDMTAKPNQHSIVMRRIGSENTVGTCDITFGSISTPIHLCIGDPELSHETARWEDVRVRDKWMTNGFELSIDLGGDLGSKVFHWKRTHDVEGVNAVSRKLDHLHLKMVDQGTNAVVARFKHNLLWGSKRGQFEFEEFGGGDDWERIVILSGTAVLEYMRKASGWSW